MEAPKPMRPKRVPPPKWRVTHHVEFVSPGQGPEQPLNEVSIEVEAHDIDVVLGLLPPDVFAFSFFDLKEADVWVEDDLVRVGMTELKSGKYYVGGTVYTDEMVEAMALDNPDQFSNLLNNMRSMGHNRVIQTSMGNWQPFEDEDVSLPALVR